MDWVLNNLENVIIPIIIMILYGIGSVGQKRKEGKKAPGQQQPQADPDEARRVREIQEEIRRKIAERTGRSPAPPPPVPTREPPARKPVPQSQPKRFPTPSSKPTKRPEPVAAPPVPSYQDEMAAKMREIKELEAQAARVAAKTQQVEGFGVKTSRTRKVPKGKLRSELFADLANPQGQRKAILVSEILGAPVGIKGPAGWKSNV